MQYQKTRCRCSGFTLMELMIILAVLAIIASIAVPAYQRYMRNAYYSEVIHAAGPYTLGVTHCYQMQGSLSPCDTGSNGVPSGTTVTSNNVSRVTVSNGVITMTPRARFGILSSDTYVLTPSIVRNNVIWSVSGGCVNSGYCKAGTLTGTGGGGGGREDDD